MHKYKRNWLKFFVNVAHMAKYLCAKFQLIWPSKIPAIGKVMRPFSIYVNYPTPSQKLLVECTNMNEIG